VASVDVVVPCYNYARFLERCVSSLLRQEGVDVRVLVIDDASSDDSETVGRALAAADARVEYRRHAVNAGHIATYNEGLLGWAKADYCLLISADDLVAPGAFARAAKLMDANPGVAFTYGTAQVFTDDEHPDESQYRPPVEQIVWPGKEYLRTTCEVGNLVATPSVIVRTSVQQQVGGYRPELPHTGDMEMWMRLAVHGSVGVVRGVQSYYRVHGNNMSTAYYGRRVRDTAEQIQAYRAIIEKFAGQVPELKDWVAIAYRRIATTAVWLAGDAFEEGDTAAANYCLDLARNLWPDVRHTVPWRKFRIKRLLGRRLMQTVRPVMQRFGLMGEVNMAAAGSLYVMRGKELGWWPSQPSGAGAVAMTS
jgi:glycosyltransferase involved in cell wall biosynthesis